MTSIGLFGTVDVVMVETFYAAGRGGLDVHYEYYLCYDLFKNQKRYKLCKFAEEMLCH